VWLRWGLIEWCGERCRRREEFGITFSTTSLGYKRIDKSGILETTEYNFKSYYEKSVPLIRCTKGIFEPVICGNIMKRYGRGCKPRPAKYKCQVYVNRN